MNSFFAVAFGLSNSAVSRLSKTWEGLTNKTRRVYQSFERLMVSDGTKWLGLCSCQLGFAFPGGREGGRERERERRREGVKERGREGGREGGRWRERRKEGEWERGRECEAETLTGDAVCPQDPSRNHRAYRMVAGKLSLPFLPFMPLLIKDLTFIEEGNKTFVNNLVNFEKMRMIARTVNLFRRCRTHSQMIPQKMEPEISSAQISTTSDQSVSVKNPQPIRLYVRSLKAIDNEQILSQLSQQLEP
uniref:Rap guanine nucleotide exchange factor 3-like n=1 Tax=Callorhinchus milii TaxID=7868 RepID=A0A4W3JF67_CALMI